MITGCDCSTFPRSFEMTIGFKPEISDSITLLEYFKTLTSDQLELERNAVPRFSGYWWVSSAPTHNWIHWFHDSQIYKCTTCGQNWLTTFNESEVSYLLHALSPNQLNSFESEQTFSKWECFKRYTFLQTKDPAKAEQEVRKIKSSNLES